MMTIVYRSVTLLLSALITLACAPLPVPSENSGSETELKGLNAVSEPANDIVDRAGEDVKEGSEDGGGEESVAEGIFTDEVVMKAVEDLADRLSISVAEIDVLEARSVTWSDESLGCAQPGVVYAQVAQDGLLIRLSVGAEMYFYHSGGTEEPFLCEETIQIVPEVTPKIDEFVPPPDSEID